MENDSQYDDCYRLALELALKAGQMIKEAFYKEKDVEEKESRIDLVTETDKAVERMVFDRIRSEYPQHCFIGEESGGEKSQFMDDPTWLIDPIDGTMNFVHQNPNTCISIGFTVKKEAVLGVLYFPVLDHLYTARRGQGAYLNGKPIHVSKVKDVSHALIAAHLAGNIPTKTDIRMRNIRKLMEASHGFIAKTAKTKLHRVHRFRVVMLANPSECIRCFGNSTASVVALASGSVDAYVEYGFHCWDIAATELLVREAGGVVMDTEGGALNIMKRRMVAASCEKIARQIVDMVETIPMAPDCQ